jgi:hypothetical protein
MLALLITLPAGALDYSMTFSIDMKKISMGSIQFEKTRDTITSIVKLKPILFIHFNQSITTKLDKNEYPVSETLLTLVNNRVLKDSREYAPNRIVFRQIASKKSNVNAASCNGRPLSVTSFVNFFINGRLLKNSPYPIFIVDKVVNLLYVSTDPTKGSVISTDNKFELDVETGKSGMRDVPKRILIKKYLVYGIKWDIFKLTLLEFKVKRP